MISELNSRPKDRQEPFWVFKFKNREGFVIIPASDTELATLRAWDYDIDLTFFGSINDFIELIKRGELCRQQHVVEVIEKVGLAESEHTDADNAKQNLE